MDAKTDEKQLSGLMIPSEDSAEDKSGLVPDTQSDKDRLEELKEAGKKEETVKQFETVSQPVANVPSFSSNNADPLLQSKMEKARQALKDKHWNEAAHLYDEILDAEPENAEANLGLFMAYDWITEKKYIPEAARDAMKNSRDVFRNKFYVRARRYADDNMQKELKSYEKGRDYLIAIEEFQRAKTIEDYQKVSRMFERLGDFADARKQKEQCDACWKKPLYDSSVQKMKSTTFFIGFMTLAEEFKKLGDYEDAEEQRKLALYLGAVCSLQDGKNNKSKHDLSAAERHFKELGDYSDSRDKAKECEEEIERLKGQDEECEKYDREYEKFEKQIVDIQEVKQHRSKISSQRAKIDSLKKKRARDPIQKRWIFLTGGLGLLCVFVPAAFQWLIHCSPECEAIYYYIADNGILAGTLELGIALIKITIIPTLIISFWVGISSEIYYGVFCFLMLAFGFPVLTGIDIFVHTHGYGKQVHFIGIAALAIAIVMIIARVAGKAMVKNMPKTKAEKIKQLEKDIDDEYEQIKRFIGREYQKIYDRYPIVGSQRKEVSTVQKKLMEKVKKHS